MGTGYVVGDDRVPLMILSSLVGGPLASIRSEAAVLLQLLRDIATNRGRHVRLLFFIDCLVLLEILRRWGTHNFNPRPKEVAHFDVIYPVLLELRQWIGDLVLVKVKSHSGCLLMRGQMNELILEEVQTALCCVQALGIIVLCGYE